VGYWPNWLLALAFIALCAPLVILLPASIIGTISAPWNEARRALVWVMGYYLGVHMLILAEDRFHLALIPFMAALAGGAPLRSRRQQIVAVLLIALALLNWACELGRDWPLLVKLFSTAGNLAGFAY